jgi:hypothetical protein
MINILSKSFHCRFGKNSRHFKSRVFLRDALCFKKVIRATTDERFHAPSCDFLPESFVSLVPYFGLVPRHLVCCLACNPVDEFWFCFHRKFVMNSVPRGIFVVSRLRACDCQVTNFEGMCDKP